MAVKGPIPSLESMSSESASSTSDVEQNDGEYMESPTRPTKRRRISNSSEEQVPVEQAIASSAPFQTQSRIRKKAPKEKDDLGDESPNQPDPINAKDAFTLGLQSTQSSFASLGLAPWLVNALKAMEIKRPTAIQRNCIPEILSGKDCIGGSRTGSGKTVAFAVPILQKWSEDPFGIYALILTPTRELALQIFEQVKAISAPHFLKAVLVTGGTDMRSQAVALSQRPHVVIATPGRLADHIKTSGDDTVCGFRRTRMMVLDEADRLLASGLGSMLPDVETCLSALPPSTARQTLLFTATMTPEVLALKSMPRAEDRPPVFITEIAADDNASIPSTLKQSYLQVPLSHREAFLHVLLSTTNNVGKSTIVFCNRTKTADMLERMLRRLLHRVTSLHSLLHQADRTANLSRFRASAARVLVATDVAARGLDIPSVGLVINYDVPRNPDDYIHRVGRTARANRGGEAITLVGQRDVKLVLAIEDRVGRQMVAWEEEGVNIETRIVKENVLRDVGSAKRDAMGEIDDGKDIKGRRVRNLKKAT